MRTSFKDKKSYRVSLLYSWNHKKSYMTVYSIFPQDVEGKIEKVPRGIQVEYRHGKFEESGLNIWSTSKSQKGERNQVSTK